MPEYPNITQIAIGHNNTGGLALVTSITIGGIALLGPKTVAAYSRGQARFTPLGTQYMSGKKSKVWTSFMTLPQYTYMRDTYSGLITAHSWLENTTEEDFNAALSFEEIGDYEAINVASQDLGWSVLAIRWNFKNVVVI